MATYKRAIDEFETEEEDGKYRLVYAYFGLAIYKAQCIEQTFANMIWLSRIFKNKVKSQEEVNEIIDSIENSKITMGGLIKEIRIEYSLTSQIQENLKSILDKRNYLIHKYFKIEIAKYYTQTGQKEMLKYFSDFIDESEALDQSLNEYYDIHTKKLGLTEEKIQKLLGEQRKEELERISKTKI